MEATGEVGQRQQGMRLPCNMHVYVHDRVADVVACALADAGIVQREALSTRVAGGIGRRQWG